MKTKRKIFIVIFTILLSICISVPTNANIESSNKIASTIDPQLQSSLQDASSTTKIPVDIWLYETSTNQTRETKIYSEIGVSKAQILTSAKISISAEKVDEYIMTERAMYANERTEQYVAFRLDYPEIEGLNETLKSNTRLFYSRYAPVIRAELTTKEIKLLARDERVQSIYYSPDITLEPEGDISVPTINADYTRDVSDCTGSGIKIGLLEARGLPNKNKSYFVDAEIYYDPNVSETFDEHAEQVAAVMVAQTTTINGITYQGIIPEATLYATYFNGTGDWRVRAEWLLDQGVHVINLSAGIANSNTYGIHEKWFDHIAIDHCVHLVKSSGNSNGKISSPGMAYNILTVGAINDMNTLDCNDDERYVIQNGNTVYGSSYIEDTGLTNKPDLVAPGVYINSAAYLDGSTYFNHGTSLSAPHVTAVVAQLCEAQPYLSAFPERVKAILTASITHSQHTYTNSDAEYDQFGAGVIDAKAAFNTAVNGRFYNTDFRANSVANTQKSYSFTVSAPTHVRVSLSWLMESSLSGNHANAGVGTHPLADLTLYIYGPDGEQIGDWHADNQNTQIADFIASEAGTYRMVVKLNETTTTFVAAALAWYFYDT